jgi:hypothetical protein
VDKARPATSASAGCPDVRSLRIDDGRVAWDLDLRASSRRANSIGGNDDHRIIDRRAASAVDETPADNRQGRLLTPGAAQRHPGDDHEKRRQRRPRTYSLHASSDPEMRTLIHLESENR